jgi:hypothetical protein
LPLCFTDCRGVANFWKIRARPLAHLRARMWLATQAQGHTKEGEGLPHRVIMAGRSGGDQRLWRSDKRGVQSMAVVEMGAKVKSLLPPGALSDYAAGARIMGLQGTTAPRGLPATPAPTRAAMQVTISRCSQEEDLGDMVAALQSVPGLWVNEANDTSTGAVRSRSRS